MTKRRPINLLPPVNRTTELQRFFGSTVDHLFQPGQTDAISGYIGRIPSYNNPETDFYKTEPNEARKKFQLEATMVSEDTTDNITDILFYDDLISRLSADGALVGDPSRLFKSEYWSWAPPVDIDKINNFQRYYWSGDDVPAITLTLPGMEVPTITKGDGSNRLFSLPAIQPCWRILAQDSIIGLNGTGVFPGCPVARIDGIRTTDFSLTDDGHITFAIPPQSGAIVELFRYGNIGDGTRTVFSFPNILLAGVSHADSDIKVYIEGRSTTAFTVVGDHIVLDSPAPVNALVTVTIFDSLRMIITGRQTFNIENITQVGVPELINGLRVNLIDPYVAFFGFDIKPNSTFKWDEMHPSLFFVDGVGIAIHLTEIASSFTGIEPQYIVVARDDKALPYFSRINRWVQAAALSWFNGATVERQAIRPICEMLPNMALFNYGRTRAPDADVMYGIRQAFSGTVGGADDTGRVPSAGDIVIFGNVGDPSLNNSFAVWPAVDDQNPNPPITTLATVQTGDVFLHNDSGDEYRWTGTVWLKCDPHGTFPLYDLFDNDGVSIADHGRYPLSDFSGSRIFNFKIGSGANDTILGFPLEYDTYGAIMFENDLYNRTYSYRDGPIQGFVYYLTGTNKYGNEWYKAINPLPAVDSNSDIVVPLNLQGNPNNGTPKEISRNNWFDHFSSIVSNQDGFTGKSYTENNWQYTARDLSLGTHIIQSRSPMIKLMLLMADNNYNVKKAIKFAESEYTRYKLKVFQKIKENSKLGLYIDAMDDDAEIVKIFNFIAANKTSDFPFYRSNIGGGTFFIPPTPASLGITQMVRPHIVSENGATFIVGHDGSKIASTDSLTDRLVLAMENRIFASREDSDYNPDNLPYLDEFDLFSGKYRNGSYTRDEATILQQANFEDWARANNSDYQTNSGYDSNNPFTWNYGSMSDKDGNEIPGNWRGIYRWYFDTETPNITPWEMVGFSEKPTWWETEYGAAPYLRSNIALWQDMEGGVIRHGARAGVDMRFVRPGIMVVLPVDMAGNLLDPIQAKIVVSPTIQFAQESWVFGDNSPIENLWRRSSSYGFAKATTLFLMRPAQFVEDYWDRDNRALVHGDQWIDISTNDRAASSELTIYGEIVNGEQKVSLGLQSWIVEQMIERGQTPEMLGDTVRGLDVRLAHKMAGFTTTDRLHVEAESFGVLPNESIQVSLYQSPDLSTDFYSGIIIENISVGRWRVIGYNALNPFFDINPSDRNGKKIALTGEDDSRIVNPWLPNIYYKVGMFVLFDGYVYEAIKNHQSIGNFEASYWRQSNMEQNYNERLYKYIDSTGGTDRVAYTTVFDNRQDVVDFIFSYQRSLEIRGFSFPENNWDEAAVKFINWSKVKWAKGTFLTLSPGARSMSYTSPQGFVLNLNSPSSSGVFVNRTGHTIDNRNVQVDRLDDTLTLTASGDDIYGVYLNKGEVEHVLVFANRTVFDDIIYDTVLNERQVRLKLHARRTTDWNGRYDAPGFIISQGQIVSNFAKSAEDIRYMFDIELADNTVLRDHARHLIGFENSPYLSNLLLNETQQFELYQGMIQQKGARDSLSKILRSRAVEGNRDLAFMEEWAFRIAEFGAFNPRGYMEFVLGMGDIRQQTQLISLSDNEPTNAAALHISPNDQRWVSPPINFAEITAGRESHYGLPNAGYVRTNEVTYAAPTFIDFSQQIADLLKAGSSCAAGESVWIYSNGINNDWTVKYLINAATTANFVSHVDNHFSNGAVIGIRISTTVQHNLSIGDYVLISGPILNNYNLSGVFQVITVGPSWFELDIDSDDVQPYDFTTGGDIGPPIFKLVDARFRVRQEALNFPISDVPLYIDDRDATGAYDPTKIGKKWGVFSANSIDANTLIGSILRLQPPKMDASCIASALIYDQTTQITENSIVAKPLALASIAPIDPIMGLIVGEADKEIDFKIEYDPAVYDINGAGTIWTDDYVGRLWWDLSTCWFIDPYTDIIDVSSPDRAALELAYRSANWSSLAVGSNVDIYEWTKSYLEPSESGLVLHPSEYYAQTYEYSASLNKEVAVYYFWVKNPTTVPSNNVGRTLDAKTCADMISNPCAAGIAWMAPISPNDMIISGIRDILTDDSTVLQIQLQLTDEDEDLPHRQWMMLRPGDKQSLPTKTLLEKFRNSLVGFDDNLAVIPKQTLHISARTGIEAGQSMFDATKKIAARQNYVDTINYQFSRHNLGASQSLGADIMNHSTPIQEYLLWSLPDGSRTIADLPPTSLYSSDQFGQPLRTTDNVQMEEWLNDDAYVYRRVLLDNRFSSNPSWSVWEKNGTGQNRVISLARHYNHIVSNAIALNVLIASGTVLQHEYVYVTNNEDFDGFWTVHDSNGVLVNAQTYRTSDFWNYADWYADGYSIDSAPVVTYANASVRNKTETINPSNVLVKLEDNGSGFWIWTAFINGRWETVAQQNGTIQLSSKFYTNTEVYGWDASTETYSFDGSKVFKRDGSFELGILFDAILDNNAIDDLEKNELWFSFVNFVHSTHDQVDWAFKTSFITVVGYNEVMQEDPVAKPDNIASLLSYIEEMKPYHATVREFARSYSPNTEIANTTAADFDKPWYFDPETSEYRRLDEKNANDLAIIEAGVWNHWLTNMDLARKFQIDMIFDRVWFQTGEVVTGAAERIMAYYQPSSSMIPKDLNTLLKLDVKGTVLDGMTFDTISDASSVIEGSATPQDIDINGDYGSETGLALRDPRVAKNTPEDMVRIGAHDLFLLRANDKWGAGAPRSLIKSYDVSNEIVTHLDLPIGMIPRNVAVFYDGRRQIEGVNYVVDYLSNNIRVALVRADSSRVSSVIFHSFGYAAHTTIIDQVYYTTPTKIDVEIPVPQNLLDYQGDHYCETTCNGRYIESTLAPNSNGDRVVSFNATANDHFVLTFYKGVISATTSLRDDYIPTPLAMTSIPQTATFNLHDILNDDFPHEKPYISNVIIEKNGLRLSPPHIYHVDRVTDKYIDEETVQASDLYVVDDMGQRTSVFGVEDTDYDSVDDILADDIPHRFILWKNYIIIRDSDALSRSYVVVVVNTGDFTIDDDSGILTVYALTNTDELRILHWRNDGIMKPRTWSFKARESGIYRIVTASKKGSTWLTVNGRRLVEDIDYSIEPTTAGAWDILPLETFHWDDLTEINITIRNKLYSQEGDDIVITTFEGPTNSEPLEWQNATLTPDVVRFKYNTQTTEGNRRFLLEENAWAVETNDLRREGGVIDANVLSDAITIQIKTNALDVPDIMISRDAIPVPNAKMNIPGVVWIGSERIEYFKRTLLDNGIVRIDQLRRGTKGTVSANHNQGDIVRVEHAFRIPKVPNLDITAPNASPADIQSLPNIPVFQGWYLKVRILASVRGRDAEFYSYDYHYDGDNHVSTGGSIDGRITLEPTGPLPNETNPLYHNASTGYLYNPYDFTYTFNYDIQPCQQRMTLQYDAFNWSSVNQTAGSPVIIEYQWWDSDTVVRAVSGQIDGLWPREFVWDIVASDARPSINNGQVTRDTIIASPDPKL